jgi:2-keto-4-pentenoate hydratase/2-oxohepta-3-ene-1,7-dioic acid hydratase in catechol pathway
MTHAQRRNALQTAAAVTVGAVAGRAAPGTAGNAPKTPFAVADTCIPVTGTDVQFPVRHIDCIGRNHAAHAREMGSDPNREPPFFFQKPTDAIQNVAPGTAADHPYPSLTRNDHYEVELVAALKSGGRDIPVSKALEHVYASAVGLDMTRRDLQRAMGDEEKPWDIGKGFDRSAPGGPLHLAVQTGHLAQGAIWLKVNGQTKQNANPAR